MARLNDPVISPRHPFSPRARGGPGAAFCRVCGARQDEHMPRKGTVVDAPTAVLLARLKAESLDSSPFRVTLWSGELCLSVYLEEFSVGACVLVVQSAGDPVRAYAYKPDPGRMWHEQRTPPAEWLERKLTEMCQGTQLATGTSTQIVVEG